MEFISKVFFSPSPFYIHCPSLRSARRAQGGSGGADIGSLCTARGGNAVAGRRLECVKVLALAGVVGRVRAADGLDGRGHAVGLDGQW